MHPIDAFEVDVLEHTGDIALAQQVGDTVRSIVAATVENVASVLGIEQTPALRRDIERALVTCPSFTVENAVVEEDDSDGA